MASTRMMSRTEVTNSISNIKISEAPREVEQTPSEPILPPQPRGNYDVDESVRACKVEFTCVALTLLTAVSFSCTWNKNRTCAELWHVTVGQDRKSHRRIALRRREKLFPQGWITSQRRHMQQLIPILQVVTLGTTGKHMCQGEFESLKAIYAVSPGFVPEPYAWGKYTREDPETYFLLAEFRDVGKQVRALSSAVVRYTLAYNNLASFLFLPPFGPQWLSRSVPFAYHTN